MGSGNLSDPKTKNYLKAHYPAVEGLRKSWNIAFLGYKSTIKKKKLNFS